MKANPQSKILGNDPELMRLALSLKEAIFAEAEQHFGKDTTAAAIRQLLQGYAAINEAPQPGKIRAWIYQSLMANNGKAQYQAHRGPRLDRQQELAAIPPPAPRAPAAPAQDSQPDIMTELRRINEKLSRIMEHLGMEDLPW